MMIIQNAAVNTISQSFEAIFPVVATTQPRRIWADDMKEDNSDTMSLVSATQNKETVEGEQSTGLSPLDNSPVTQNLNSVEENNMDASRTNVVDSTLQDHENLDSPRIL